MGLGQAPRQELLAESSQTKVMCLGSRFTLYYVLRQKKKGETIIAAARNAWHMMGLVWKAQVDSKYKRNVFKATVQGALLSGLCVFARQFYMVAAQKTNSSRWKHATTGWRDGSLE